MEDKVEFAQARTEDKRDLENERLMDIMSDDLIILRDWICPDAQIGTKTRVEQAASFAEARVTLTPRPVEASLNAKQ